MNVNKIYNENDVKICLSYNQFKSITEYLTNKSQSVGLEYICKSCKSIIVKRYRENIRTINANRIYTENDVQPCSKCEQQKLYTKFNKCISNKSKL